MPFKKALPCALTSTAAYCTGIAVNYDVIVQLGTDIISCMRIQMAAPI